MDRSVALACRKNLATISIGTIVTRLMILAALALFLYTPGASAKMLNSSKTCCREAGRRRKQTETSPIPDCNSGVMTFIINQGGVPLQQDLGKSTTETATAMTEFDPDTSWSPVEQ